MKTTKCAIAVAIGLVGLVAPKAVRADSFSIAASERGWVCTSSSSACPVSSNNSNSNNSNNGANPGNNYLAGYHQLNAGVGGQFRDWFEFSIPTLTGGSLVSATLQIDEPVLGHQGGALTYAVYGLSGQPLVFTDVTTSNPFGSVGTSAVSNATTLAITLDAAALAAISADQGANIFIGGVDSGELATTTSTSDFGGTFSADNTVLSLQTVPEPRSLFLLGTGLLGLMAMTWRRTLLA